MPRREIQIDFDSAASKSRDLALGPGRSMDFFKGSKGTAAKNINNLWKKATREGGGGGRKGACGNFRR